MPRCAVPGAPFAVIVALSLALMAGCGSEDAPAASAEPGTAATAEGSDSPDTPDSPDAAAGGPSPELTSALADVQKVAPRLESLYRNKEYPRDLDDVVASMDDAQLELSDGNSLGAYRYDEKSVEFVLCVENSSGAFATYDTAPMATGEKGEEGSCPQM